MNDSTDADWVDSHFHLFNRRELTYSWLDEYNTDFEQLLGDYRPLQKEYPFEEYFAEAVGAGLKKAVHIEAAFGSDPVRETAWLQSVADQASIPLAIIGHADLTAPDIASLLDRHCAHSAFRGVRMLWGADQASSSEFRRGFAEIAARNLVYEVASIWNSCYEKVVQLAADFPDACIVIEHHGLPLQRDEAYLSLWRDALNHLAAQKNIMCKISGVGMLDHSWTVDRIRPMVQTVIDAFGTDRCFFGSNWPNDSLYGRSYVDLIQAYREVIVDQPAAARKAMLSGNASRIYRI